MDLNEQLPGEEHRKKLEYDKAARAPNPSDRIVGITGNPHSPKAAALRLLDDTIDMHLSKVGELRNLRRMLEYSDDRTADIVLAAMNQLR